jgi:DNA-binding MarR family transcriptional regulator
LTLANLFVPSPDPLDDALWAASDVMRGVFARRVAELGLTPPQALILRLLVHPRPMKDLAAEMLFDPSYVTALVDGLEERGLAERRPDPNDRRIKLVAVTDAGRVAQFALQQRISSSLPGINRLSNDERVALARLLSKAMQPDATLPDAWPADGRARPPATAEGDAASGPTNSHVRTVKNR